MKNAKKMALSIGYNFKLCMKNASKRKKWWLEKPERKHK